MVDSKKCDNMSASKCKRGPEVLLCATSSSSDDDSPRSVNTSITEPPSPALTNHHDYDVSSPGSSSTLSGGGGPSVARPPGFTQHAQQTPRRPRVKKKKADVNVSAAEVECSLETPRSEQTDGQLAPSRLAKHQLPARTKLPRGTQPSPYVSPSIFCNSLICMHKYVYSMCMIF